MRLPLSRASGSHPRLRAVPGLPRLPRRKVLLLLAVVSLLATSCGRLESLSTREALDRLNIATTKLYAADGSLIANLHGEVNRDIVPLEDIPEHVQNAVIAIEDERFWSHAGLDVKSIARAAVRNAGNAVTDEDDLQGGSTISQQLVKNLYFPRQERTVQRKIAEARVTWQFEREYSKRQILEMYLNTIYFGRGVYGIQTAAKSWFRKDTSDLSLPEAAFLAGIIHEPAKYDFGPNDPSDRQTSRRDRGVARRRTVLNKMAELGFVDEQEAESAATAPLEPADRMESEWLHPYFADMVMNRLGVLGCTPENIDHRFDEPLGTTCRERQENVYKGGLRIYTTMDPKVQQAAEEAVDKIKPRSVDKMFGSLVAIEPSTGYVRGLVGGRDYYPDCDPDDPSFACRSSKVNLALGRRGGASQGRQPGSSFKPLVLAAALERGVSLRSRFGASPFTHRYDGQAWNVRNYEGSGGGSMDLVEGTVSSVNAVYAHLLIDGVGDGDEIAGASAVADLARRMGVEFPTRAQLRASCGDSYGEIDRCIPADDTPAIALGAREVSPFELANVYATFANEGVHVEPTAVVRITDGRGRTLFEAEPKRQRAMPRGVALAATSVMEQVVERGTGTRARIDRPAAGKTGTAQQWRDAWFGGYVPQLAAVAWVGNPRGQEEMTPANGYPMKVVGGSYPAQIWQYFMTKALEGVPVERFPDPPKEFFVPKYSPPPVTQVPNVLGLFVDDAIAELRAAGLQAAESQCLHRGVPGGTVVKQSPDPGAEVNGGSAVEICVSIHELPQPELHEPSIPEDFFGHQPADAQGTVPNVIGESLARAHSEISRAGFQMSSTRECDPSGSADGGRVWQQSPAAGSHAPQGSTVTVWYNGAGC